MALAIGSRAVIVGEWKLVGEYERLLAVHGDTVTIAFALLVIYYLCEAAVIVLVIAPGQCFAERRFGSPGVPWGGFVLVITWGATHILLQGPHTGAYAMIASVLYGCIYSLGPRRSVPVPTYAMVAAAFIL